MRRLAVLVLVALLLAVPGSVGAQGAPIVEGVPFDVWQTPRDLATVTVLESKRTRRAAGLGYAGTGRRWYLLRLRYVGREGHPVAVQFDWHPAGGNFRVVLQPGTRKRLPATVLPLGRAITGWVAWNGPSSPAGVSITMHGHELRP